MQALRQIYSYNARAFNPKTIVAIGALLTGVAVVQAPIIPWIVVGALSGLLLLECPVYVWVAGTVLAATLSRWVVAIGVLPSIFNFFHFPLALGAALVATLKGTPQSPVVRSIAIGSIALLFLSFISWAFNGGGIFRPILNWLVFLEPFLLIYAILRMPYSVSTGKLMRRLALGIPFVQLPLALWQALTMGVGDRVQGTFVGMGAGHHVAGGVALAGALVCVARGVSAPIFKKRMSWLLGGMLLLVVAVLSDAKQNIAAFLLALTLLLFMSRVRLAGLIVSLPILIAAIVIAFSYHPSLRAMTNVTMVKDIIVTKGKSVVNVAERLSENPGGWLFGIGPGNSLSRVALMGFGERGFYLRPDSPVALLGLRLAPTTKKIFDLGVASQYRRASSVGSNIASWIGLFGDLGLIGLGLYLWLSWQVWRNLKGWYKWEVNAAKSVLVMVGILGGMYSWLEEPGFTLTGAVIVGLGIIASQRGESSVHNLSHSQFVPEARR